MDPDQDGKLFVGKGTKPEYLTLALANRHGLAAGATGTGKTVTLQVLAEGFSRAGVSVFAADVKGDLSGIAAPGEAKEALVKRAKEMGFDYEPDRFPVVFWDLFGEQGHPVRATISEVGPILLSRMMSLNDVQEGVLNIAFRVADEHGLLLDDLKDLRSFLTFLTTAEGEKWATEYGHVSKPTVGTIQRQILVLENQGGTNFFSLPTIKFDDFMHTDKDGRGRINILAADKLMQNPRLYATFLLWLLSQLFQELPEVGDPPKPKLVFFFDEAHLLFTDAPKALLDQIEQVVRLIRSKGVGVYFVTQNPLDVPDKVLAQLGNRVQHALRAFTPRDQKAVKAAAETFRPNPKLDTAKVIMELGKGEALVSFLEGNGTPTMVERALIRPPAGRIGPLTPEERKAVIAGFAGQGQVRQDDRSRVRLRSVAESALPPDAAPRSEQKEAGEPSQAGGRRLLGTAHGHSGDHLRHQPQARPAALSAGQADGARCHPHRQQSGRRPDRRRYRQVAWRVQPAARSVAPSCAARWAECSSADPPTQTESNMTPSQALPAVLDRIDADLDKASSGCSSSCASNRSRPTRPMRSTAARRRSSSRRIWRASASRRACARPRGIRSSSARRRTASAARACCSTATTTCSRSIRSICGRRRRSSRASRPCRTAARSSSRAAPATTKAR